MRGLGISAIDKNGREKIGRRYRGAVVFARLAIIAAFAIGLAATPGHAQVRITDVADLGGDEVVGPINSVAAILNQRACLTFVEKANLANYLQDLGEQLEHDFIRLNNAGFVSKRELSDIAASNGPLSSGDRARLKLSNLEHDLLRYIRELEHYPTCPPGSVYPQIGFFIGGHFIKLTGDVKSTERLDATGQVTNQFSDSKDPVGGGLIVGAKFTPWSNNVVLAPFASFDFLHAAVNHTFAGGSFLGSTANFIGTAGVKVGPQFQSFWAYGIAGVSVLNETLNVNFLPVTSSTDANVPGATIGAGFAYKLPNLPNVSLFAEYQHTWWRDGKFNTPAASPLFNYTFARQDDVAKLGFTVSLGAPPLPPLSNLPVKAPISK
jgi:hypothetical protein